MKKGLLRARLDHSRRDEGDFSAPATGHTKSRSGGLFLGQDARRRQLAGIASRWGAMLEEYDARFTFHVMSLRFG